MPEPRDIIDEWTRYFRLKKRKKQSTVDTYARLLRRLQEAKGPLDQLTADDVHDFEWENQAKWHPNYFWAIKAFYEWWSEKEGKTDPSAGLTQPKPRRTKQRIPADLFDLIAKLEHPFDRAAAQLMYLQELRPDQLRELINDKSRGPDFEVSTRGLPKELHLEEPELDLLFYMRRQKRANRTFQRYFEKAGFTATQLKQAGKEDRGAPALRLLVRHPRFSGVAAGLRSALAQVETNPARAIQDAATALEDLFKEMGADGNRLGPLVKSGQRHRGLLGHDPKLADAIKLMADWVAADRVASGSGHSIRRGATDDAWLALRVVEALVIRLVKGFPPAEGYEVGVATWEPHE